MGLCSIWNLFLCKLSIQILCLYFNCSGGAFFILTIELYEFYTDSGLSPWSDIYIIYYDIFCQSVVYFFIFVTLPVFLRYIYFKTNVELIVLFFLCLSQSLKALLLCFLVNF